MALRKRAHLRPWKRQWACCLLVQARTQRLGLISRVHLTKSATPAVISVGYVAWDSADLILWCESRVQAPISNSKMRDALGCSLQHHNVSHVSLFVPSRNSQCPWQSRYGSGSLLSLRLRGLCFEGVLQKRVNCLCCCLDCVYCLYFSYAIFCLSITVNITTLYISSTCIVRASVVHLHAPASICISPSLPSSLSLFRFPPSHVSPGSACPHFISLHPMSHPVLILLNVSLYY